MIFLKPLREDQAKHIIIALLFYIGYNASRNSDNKRKNNAHCEHPLQAECIGGGNIFIILPI